MPRRRLTEAEKAERKAAHGEYVRSVEAKMTPEEKAARNVKRRERYSVGKAKERKAAAKPNEEAIAGVVTEAKAQQKQVFVRHRVRGGGMGPITGIPAVEVPNVLRRQKNLFTQVTVEVPPAAGQQHHHAGAPGITDQGGRRVRKLQLERPSAASPTADKAGGRKLVSDTVEPAVGVSGAGYNPGAGSPAAVVRKQREAEVARASATEKLKQGTDVLAGLGRGRAERAMQHNVYLRGGAEEWAQAEESAQTAEARAANAARAGAGVAPITESNRRLPRRDPNSPNARVNTRASARPGELVPERRAHMLAGGTVTLASQNTPAKGGRPGRKADPVYKELLDTRNLALGLAGRKPAMNRWLQASAPAGWGSRLHADIAAGRVAAGPAKQVPAESFRGGGRAGTRPQTVEESKAERAVERSRDVVAKHPWVQQMAEHARAGVDQPAFHDLAARATKAGVEVQPHWGPRDIAGALDAKITQRTQEVQHLPFSKGGQKTEPPAPRRAGRVVERAAGAALESRGGSYAAHEEAVTSSLAERKEARLRTSAAGVMHRAVTGAMAEQAWAATGHTPGLLPKRPTTGSVISAHGRRARTMSIK